MLLPPFQHHRPTELAAAHDLLARFGEEAAAYAGGTEILLAMKARVLRYAHLVDLKHIAALDGIRQESGEIVIGALTSHFRLASDPLIRRVVPAYASLSDGIANIRVRVAGTLGGNLCFAEPHADPPALLAALGALVTLRSADSTRSVPVAAFIEGEFTTARRDDELLTEIRIPVPGANERFCYRSFGQLERPAVAIAAGCSTHNKSFRYRVWAGAIADRPIRLSTLEDALNGVPPADVMDVLPSVSVEAAATLPAHDDLHGSADYKQHLAAVFMRRTVAEVARMFLEERAGSV